MVYRGGSWINIKISYSFWGYLASVAGNTGEEKGVKSTKFPLPLRVFHPFQFQSPPPPHLLCKRNRLLGGHWSRKLIYSTNQNISLSLYSSLSRGRFWLGGGGGWGWTVWGKKRVSFNPRNMWLDTVDLLSSNHPLGHNRLPNKGRPLKKGLCLQGW